MSADLFTILTSIESRIAILTNIESKLDRLLADREDNETMSVDQFCKKYGISRSLFYDLGLPYSKVKKRSITTDKTRAAYKKILSENTKNNTKNV